MAGRISVMELCTRRALEVDPRRVRAAMLAGKVCAFVVEWAAMIRETGNDAPTVEDFAAWACVSRATAFRRQQDFRRLFGEWHDDPTPMARYVNRWIDQHSGRSGEGAEVPAALVAV
jgi:hypothetical protein